MRPAPAHHLVMDQQDAVSVADFADARKIAVGRHKRRSRRPAYRLHDEGEHAFRPFGHNLFLEHIGIFNAALCHRKIVAVTIGGRRGHSRHVTNLRRECFGQRQVAGHAERADRAAMIGREPADDLPAFSLIGSHRPLPRQLDSQFDRLRAAGYEEYPVEVAGHSFGQSPGQFLRGLVFEMKPVGEGDAVQLPLHRVDHMAVSVADIDHHRAA